MQFLCKRCVLEVGPATMLERPRFDEDWRDRDGNWHDCQGNVYGKKRDLLQHRSEACGCQSCSNTYTNYMLRVQEDRGLKRSAIADLSFNWHFKNNPEHTRYRIDYETGGVFPVGDDYLDDDDVFDLLDSEDGEVEDDGYEVDEGGND